jgi:hypothetical protein
MMEVLLIFDLFYRSDLNWCKCEGKMYRYRNQLIFLHLFQSKHHFWDQNRRSRIALWIRLHQNDAGPAPAS